MPSQDPVTRAAPSISSVPYLPGLDGLRALAVLAVIAYHADVPMLRGGFLGVEVFFVVSGYLITLLLLAEHERTGRISLRAFWGRRARRLLPALFALLAAVAALSAFVPYLRKSLAVLRDELLWAFFYGSNWFQIVDNQSYFEAQGRPPLLRHLWSLAVEEQFYVVWPLVMVLVLRLFRDRLPSIGLAFFTLAIASTVWMAVLYDPADPNRVYLGTDTRASGLLLGAGLAMVWRPYAVMRSPLRRKGNLLDLVGVAGLAVLVATHVGFRDVVYTGDGVRGFSILYRGGFLLVGLATMAVIASATHLGSRFGQRVLGARPLAWLGTRSYGLYLWHWPVFQLTRPGSAQDGGDLAWPGWAVMILRFAVTITLTELSFRLIEVPIRTRRFKGWIRMVVRGVGSQQSERRRRLAAGALVMASVSAFTGISVATAKDATTDIQQSLEAGADAVTEVEDLIEAAVDPAAPEAPDTSAVVTTLPALDPSSSAETTAAPTTVPAPTTTAFIQRIPQFAVGDSVMLGAAPNLQEQGIVVDARVSRQATEGIEIVRSLADNQLLGDVLVVHLGTNGPTTKDRFVELLTLAADVPLVVLLTVKCPKPWEGEVNSAIYDVADEFPNVRLLDWNGLSQSGIAPERTFYGDGIHLREEGRVFYTQLIQEVIRQG